MVRDGIRCPVFSAVCGVQGLWWESGWNGSFLGLPKAKTGTVIGRAGSRHAELGGHSGTLARRGTEKDLAAAAATAGAAQPSAPGHVLIASGFVTLPTLLAPSKQRHSPQFPLSAT